MGWELALRSLLASGVVVAAAGIFRAGLSRDRLLLGGGLSLLALPVLSGLPRWEVGIFDPVAGAVWEGSGLGGTALVFATVWGAGTIIVFLRWGCLLRELKRVFAASQRCGDRRVSETVGRCVVQLGIPHAPQIWLTGQISSPAVSGLLLPRLLLPRDALGWSDAQLRSVIFHEMAHLARRDLWRDVVFRCASAVYWWNPLVWWLGVQHRVERESRCDAMVVGAGIPATDYARALLALAMRPAAKGTLAMGDAGDGHPCRLEERVTRLFKPSSERVGVGAAAFGAAVVVALVVSIVVDPVGRSGDPVGIIMLDEVELRLTADPFPGDR